MKSILPTSVALLSFSLSTYAGTCEQDGYVSGNQPEGPKYVVLNESAKYFHRGNLLRDGDKTANFYTSEDGYVGYTKYDDIYSWERRAAKMITFDNLSSLGDSHILIEPSMAPEQWSVTALCRNVVVQKTKPTVSGSNSSSSLTSKINYQVDRNSRAQRESLGTYVAVYSRTAEDPGLEFRGSERVFDTSGTVTISNSGFRSDQGLVTFYAQVFDGTFYSGLKEIGTYEYTAVPPSENNQTQGCTWSSSPSYGNGMGGGSYYEYPPVGDCQYSLKIVETSPSGVTTTSYR